MTSEKNKRKSVSIKPSDAVDTYTFNGADKKAIKSISDQSIDEVTVQYSAPSNDDGYFSFRSPPIAWVIASDSFSESHLFLHTFCLASHDKELRDYCDMRKSVLDICRSKKTSRALSGMLSGWLLNRPSFRITRLQTDKGRFIQWNGWSKEVMLKFRGLSRRDYGLTATNLWIVFSSKSMLTSEEPILQLDELQENLVAEWDRWLSQELHDFADILATVTHYDTITNVGNRIIKE